MPVRSSYNSQKPFESVSILIELLSQSEMSLSAARPETSSGREYERRSAARHSQGLWLEQEARRLRAASNRLRAGVVGMLA